MSSSSGVTGNPSETRHPPSAESLDVAVSGAYQELRAIAHRRLAGRIPGGTLSTTALINETYLKLVGNSSAEGLDPAHFLALASLAMRHVLVDRARERSALKRGGAPLHITLDEENLRVDEQAEMLLNLDEALGQLAAWEPRLARVVDCRFFGGLTEAETAEALDVTVRTVQRDWVKARILLRRALES
ncbi:MAG TPA: ECF-type sigma factor [Gemmatimonadaceae bacterium]|nr:ECF-type sigma factor [Gemmatimonadaceae bacterium]